MKIFCDFDNTLAKTNEAIVKCVNEKFHLGCKEEDISDWGYRSLYSGMTEADIENFFESDTFWNNVCLYTGALDVLKGHEVHLCTVGTSKNLAKKRAFAESNGFIPAFVNSDYGYHSSDKKMFDMSGAIQIGDTWREMEYTNADVKILFKDYHDYEWQQVPPNVDVYIVDSWEEISDIIRWYGLYGR